MRDPSFALKINKKFLALLSPTMYHYHNDTARDAQSFEPSFQYYVNQEEPMKKIEFAPFVMIRAIRVPVSSSAFIGFLFLKNLRKSAQISKPFSSWCSFVIRALSWITSFLLHLKSVRISEICGFLVSSLSLSLATVSPRCEPPRPLRFGSCSAIQNQLDSLSPKFYKEKHGFLRHLRHESTKTAQNRAHSTFRSPYPNFTCESPFTLLLTSFSYSLFASLLLHLCVTRLLNYSSFIIGLGGTAAFNQKPETRDQKPRALRGSLSPCSLPLSCLAPASAVVLAHVLESCYVFLNDSS